MIEIVASAFFGILIASLGAWKDTLWEPFAPRKFVRSPIITTFWGWVISNISFFSGSHWLLMAMSAVTMERLTVETWKALFRKMPGKFKRRKIRDTCWLPERIEQAKKRFSGWYFHFRCFSLFEKIQHPGQFVETGHRYCCHFDEITYQCCHVKFFQVVFGQSAYDPHEIKNERQGCK